MEKTTLQDLYDLQSYIKERFPKTLVTVYEGDDEWDHEFSIDSVVIAYLDGMGQLYQTDHTSDIFIRNEISLQDLKNLVTL